jgi:alpha-ketoglutaric semialdehyde dehydrogenase
VQPVLIAGRWQPSRGTLGSFRAANPSTGEAFGPQFPVSSDVDVEGAVASATKIAPVLAATPATRISTFLDTYAALIEDARADLSALAHAETALPIEPRINTIELPRTVDQLRQAARAARMSSWCDPVIDTRSGIRRCRAPLSKPVVVFGPNNFPLAFNAVAGSDFASAIAARNPVIAKVHPGHPQTSTLLVELALRALAAADMPAETVQLLYHLPNEIGLRLAGEVRIGAVGFTGSRAGGLALKAAADAAGVLIYVEMSSINPVFLLPGALQERCADIATEFFNSCTAGSGQFCTNPGLVVLPDSVDALAFVETSRRNFAAAPAANLLSRSVCESLECAIAALRNAGAELLVGGARARGSGYRFEPSLLSVSAKRFLAMSKALQSEAFGPASLLVVCTDGESMSSVAGELQGNLTATIYSANDGRDTLEHHRIAAVLRPRVGRLVNNKMPTGVAVSRAMNHGGPYPATAHPGFTGIGMPAAIQRFSALHCFDNVRENYLPAELRDSNPIEGMQRCIDGLWTTANVA